MHNMPTLSITGIKWPIIAPMTTVVIGDDWVFKYTAIQNISGIESAINLTGYAANAVLDVPNASFIDVSTMIDTSNLYNGICILTVSRTITSMLMPYDCGYSVKVSLTDTLGFKSTCIVVPLNVVEA